MAAPVAAAAGGANSATVASTAVTAGLDTAANIASGIIAAKNRRINIDLANSSHQREVRDLMRAGINPVLTATGGGSPVPGNPMPNIQSSHSFADYPSNKRADQMSTLQKQLLSEQIKSQVEQTGINSAVKSKTLSDAKLSALQVQNYAKQLGLIESQTSLNSANVGAIQAQQPQRDFYSGLWGLANNVREAATSKVSKIVEGIKSDWRAYNKFLEDEKRRLNAPYTITDQKLPPDNRRIIINQQKK